jgi:hypothetical protein
LSLANYQILVDGIIQDTAGKLDRTTKDAAIQAAVATYSTHVPRRQIGTLTGNGTAFDFAVPTDWEDGLSDLVAVEHPVDQQTPEFLDAADYTVRVDPATGDPMIRFFSLILSSGEKAYITYGVSHVLSGTVDTIPVSDRLAVSKLAAAECARMLAAYYAQTGDPTIGADTINYRTKSQDYLALAKTLEEAYRNHVGAPDGNVAASVSMDYDVELQTFRGPPFFHSNLDR